MKSTRKLSRRSFLATVAGGSVAGAAAIVLAATGAEAQTSDSDSGRNADRPGHGRTGVTDRDRGAGSDLPGHGRGRRSARSGITDRDSGRGADSPGNGRGRGRRACTDSDSGRNSDGVGRGRRC